MYQLILSKRDHDHGGRPVPLERIRLDSGGHSLTASSFQLDGLDACNDHTAVCGVQHANMLENSQEDSPAAT